MPMATEEHRLVAGLLNAYRSGCFPMADPEGRAGVPGAMVWLGNGGQDGNGAGLHNSRYDFNDMAIPFGVSFFVRTVERFLEKRPG